MTTQKDGQDDAMRRLQEALARYVSRWPGKRVCRPRHPVYCGYKDDPASLEVYLWELVQSSAERAEEDFPKHVRDCPYCLTRIRDITRAVTAALDVDPHPMWEPGVKPAVVGLALKRLKRRIGQATVEFLVGVKALGEWLSGAEGSYIQLAPIRAQAWRGVRSIARRGEAEPGAVGEREVRSLTVQREVDDLTISAEVAAPAGAPELLVRVVVTGTSDRPSGDFSIEYSIDGTVQEPSRLDSNGCFRVALPRDFTAVEVRLCLEGREVCLVRIDTEP